MDPSNRPAADQRDTHSNQSNSPTEDPTPLHTPEVCVVGSTPSACAEDWRDCPREEIHLNVGREFIEQSMSSDIQHDGDIPAGTPLDQLNPMMRHIHEVINSKCNVAHAIQVVFDEVETQHLCKGIYEAGLLMCMSTFIKFASSSSTPKLDVKRMMNAFTPETAGRLLGFHKRFQRFLGRAATLESCIRRNLSLSDLPEDANVVWNEQNDRFVSALERIELSPTERGDIGYHTQYVFFIFKISEKLPRIQITQLKTAQVTLPKPRNEQSLR
jgi:hypothetical protein